MKRSIRLDGLLYYPAIDIIVDLCGCDITTAESKLQKMIIRSSNGKIGIDLSTLLSKKYQFPEDKNPISIISANEVEYMTYQVLHPLHGLRDFCPPKLIRFV